MVNFCKISRNCESIQMATSPWKHWVSLKKIIHRSIYDPYFVYNFIGWGSKRLWQSMSLEEPLKQSNWGCTYWSIVSCDSCHFVTHPIDLFVKPEHRSNHMYAIRNIQVMKNMNSIPKRDMIFSTNYGKIPWTTNDPWKL